MQGRLQVMEVVTVNESGHGMWYPFADTCAPQGEMQARVALLSADYAMRSQRSQLGVPCPAPAQK
jgi:hypothetical protein